MIYFKINIFWRYKIYTRKIKITAYTFLYIISFNYKSMYPIYTIQTSKQIFQRGPPAPTLKKEYLKQIFDSLDPFRLSLKIKLNTFDFMQIWASFFNNVSKYDIFENNRIYISIYVYIMFYRLSYKNHITKSN